jgi:ABC-type multidrug transport system fused ATPase/permease subunit
MNYLKIFKFWIKYSSVYGLTRWHAFILIAMSILGSITEVLGVSAFLPIFQYMRLDGDMSILMTDSKLWQGIFEFYNFFNLEVNLPLLLIVAFTLFLLRQIIVYIRIVTQATITQYLQKKCRDKLFSLYLSAKSSHQEQIHIGDLVNGMTTETNAAISGIMAPMELIVLITLIVFYMVTLSFISYEMTLLALVVFFIAALAPRRWIKRSKEVGRNATLANTNMSSFLVERVSAPRLVRLSNMENQEKKNFKKLTNNQRIFNVRGAVLQSRTEVAIEPIVIAASLFFLYLSFSYYQLGIEAIGLYFVIALRLMPIVKSALVTVQRIQRLLASIELVQEKTENMMLMKENDDTSPLLKLKFKQSIDFNHVSYRHNSNDKNILSDINLSIERGSMTAIVGPSGGGKTTLIDLLPRLKYHTEGNILIDGIDIEKIRLLELRGMISYLPQDSKIFNGTIREHILYGQSNKSDDVVWESLKLSSSDKFVSNLPDGLDTVIGNGGVRLSGGQIKRIDLARVIASRSPIIILDEPTSSLDVHSEKKVHLAVKKIHQELSVTIIIVSHQLSIVSDADKTIVVQDGKIAATGTHQELLNINNWYAGAWEVQKDRFSS